jgi:uncharacterized DUF497 family protein
VIRIEALEISDAILEKLQVKHGVTWEEVEEVCFSERLHARRGRDGRLKLFSQTDPGRYLLVVLAHREEGLWAVVTARDMTLPERRLYRKHRGE